jgi:hypothetical protein
VDYFDSPVSLSTPQSVDPSRFIWWRIVRASPLPSIHPCDPPRDVEEDESDLARHDTRGADRKPDQEDSDRDDGAGGDIVGDWYGRLTQPGQGHHHRRYRKCDSREDDDHAPRLG